MKTEKVQTEAKNNKPSKLSKIISIVILAVITICSIATLILAVTPKNYNFGFNEPTSIKIHTSNQSISASKWYKNANDGVYDKVMELYNNSFKTTMLNALFKGALSQGVTVEEGYSYFSSIEGDYIEFEYNDAQTLKLGNKAYVPTNSGINTKFVSVIIKVDNTNSLSPVTAYIRHGGESTNYTYSRVRFNSFAVQAELYEYINSL